MKACPHCQSTYEDWIEFCFNDGVPLVAHVPKPAATPPPATPRPAAPAVGTDLPEARIVSGADLPEPAFLGRFNRAASPLDAPEPQRASAADLPTPQLAPKAAPAPAPVEPPAPPPPAPEPEPEPAAAAAAPEPPPTDDESEPTTIDPEGPRGDEVATTAPSAPVPAAIVEESTVRQEPARPAPAPVAPAPDLDADAFREIASALQEPAPSTVATRPFLPPTSGPSEDEKATVPMYTPQPERSAPREKSALDDDEPSSNRAAAAAGGIGVMVAGLLLLGAFVLVAAGGIWWTMSRSAPPEPVAEAKANPVLPAPAPAPTPPAAPVTPPPEPVTAPETPPEPVATAPTPPPATTPTPTATTPTTTAAKTPTAPTTTPPTRTPTTTPPTTAATRTTTSTTSSSASVTSDSVWGAAPEPTSGMLKIVTNPDGANVFVNETPKGKSPVTVEMPYGTHTVKVQKAGYKVEAKDVNIRVQELTVPFNLKPDVVTGQVNVYGPDGYRVVVDGHDMGPMPVTVQVSEGARQFKIVGADGGGCTQTRDIKFKAAGHPETITLACP